MYFWQSAMKSTKKEKLLRLQPSMAKKMKAIAQQDMKAHCSKSVFKFYGNSLLAYIYRADYFI